MWGKQVERGRKGEARRVGPSKHKELGTDGDVGVSQQCNTRTHKLERVARFGNRRKIAQQ